VAEAETIRKRIETLDKLQEENRINKEMLKGELENDLAYLETVEQVKAASQKRKELKQAILDKGPNQEIVASIKDNQEEISTLREILSVELMDFYQKTKSEEIAGRRFVFSAKILPKGVNEKRDVLGKYSK